MTTLELKPIPQWSQAPVNIKPEATPKLSVVDIVTRAIEGGADMAKLTEIYLKLRNAAKDLDEQLKAKKAPIKIGLDLIESHFLARMNELKVDALKNEAGTPYRSKKVSITVADNEAFMDFVLSRALESVPINATAREAIKNAILESGQLALLEARCSKSAVEALMEETQALPPGLNHRVESTVNVRAD